jgi:hypothetical protein
VGEEGQGAVASGAWGEGERRQDSGVVGIGGSQEAERRSGDCVGFPFLPPFLERRGRAEAGIARGGEADGRSNCLTKKMSIFHSFS